VKTNKWLAARFYQLKTGHHLTGQYLKWTKSTFPCRQVWCFFPAIHDSAHNFASSHLFPRDLPFEMRKGSGGACHTGLCIASIS